MSRNKLPTTRPEFLFGLMGGDYDALTTSSMRDALVDSHVLSYCAYTVLMDACIDKKDILNMNCDGESIAITLRTKAQAKAVKECCNKEIVRYGSKRYQVKLKARDHYLIAEVKELDAESGNKDDDQE